VPTRQEAIEQAARAARRAEILAQHTESAAHSTEHRHQTVQLAAAGGLWADVARAYLDLAMELPAGTERAGG
jgi:hypothetical protein